MWLGERGITPRSPKSLSMVRSGFFQFFLHLRDWEAAFRGLRVEWSEEWEYGGVFLVFHLVLVRN